MDKLLIYPKRYRESIRRLVSTVGMSVETAYAQMLFTATLMDLHPEDDEVVHIILQDCGIEVD